MKKSLFWADRIADNIINKKRFHYLNKPVKYKKYAVKSSASLSGVLHIGRLSDTIRSEAVYNSLKEKGVKAEFIWVAEDMDPLRKIPAGVPKTYEQYIGVPVSKVPDADGCHNSYASHHQDEYLKVLYNFVRERPAIYSTTKEYENGNFTSYVEKILNNVEMVREIINKCKVHEYSKLSDIWVPWKPICENCKKIITTKFLGMEKGKVLYKCEDYNFENNLAKGCSYEGLNDPKKGKGKLLWKSEWATEWARWSIVSEGAGKEYNTPFSAFFINGEIVEKIFEFPEPEPIFYEYITIGGGKMSASVGNVIFPKNWLEVADSAVLRYFFLKRINKAREFKWRDIPRLVDEYDNVNKIYFGKAKAESVKEEKHLKRLFELSQINKPKYIRTPTYAFALSLVQMAKGKEIKLLQKIGHLPKRLTKEQQQQVNRRLYQARSLLEKPDTEEYKINILKKLPKLTLTKDLKNIFLDISKLIEKGVSGEELQQFFYHAANKSVIQQQKLFSTTYQLFLGKESGPRLGLFLISLDKDFVIKRLRLES